MRISVDKSDVSFIEGRAYERFVVTLNGEVVDECITADDEAGYILKYKKPIEVTHGYEIKTEEVYGEVRITKQAC